jgi:phosphatidylinositol 4-kinase type 2
MPGQSYISEAAASVLDLQLGTNIVPRTEIVSLASPAFYYDWIDLERAARRNGQLREKDGSFQVFLKGFTGTSLPRCHARPFELSKRMDERSLRSSY